MNSYDDVEHAWSVGHEAPYGEISQDEINTIKDNPYGYLSGITYDAYSVGGYDYTKGASYYDLYGNQ